VLWLVVVPALSTFFGLVIAFLTDRIWWGNIAKTLIFMPMAISFVGASVIWKFIYDYRSEGSTQIGLLNAIVQGLGGEPQVWISIPFWNNFFLMVILIWIQTGFAMVSLRRSAVFRGDDRGCDHDGPIRQLFYIMVLQIWGTIAGVTTITITASYLTSCGHDQWAGKRRCGQPDVRLTFRAAWREADVRIWSRSPT
jgi:alpha-glucoside transport system permease protein